MNKGKNGPDKKGRMLKGSLIATVITAVAILTAVSGNYFTFLDVQLFEEYRSHLVEFTDKASEIVDDVIEYSWQQAQACEYVVKSTKISSGEELLELLGSAACFIDETNSLVLAINEKAGYYSSDQHTGRWPQTEYLTAKRDSRQLIAAEIPHKEGYSYFIFLQRLDVPAKVDGTADITHIAVAVDIEAMREKISVSGFRNRCYTYLVNQDGRRLYKHTYANNFIEGYNVLNAFRDVRILHGGTYEEYVEQLKQGSSTALEFEFVNENGQKENWFVANAPISSENWQILLFVPAGVLGEYTSLLLDGTVRFFAVVFVVFLVMVAVIIVVAMISRADKRLVRQKEEANRLLITAAEEANSANQAKSDFLSHMSHDIRTPINGIMGMTDIAIKNIGNQEKVLDCLNKISGSSQHLRGLINDVLDMSRIESGKTKANHACFDIRTCISNCTSIIGGQLATRDIELIQEIDAFEHPLLVGDELHLRQVFINILGNSVKFTPDGGRICLRARELKSAEGKALFHFELADTGIGMKEEFLPHLFEAFSQEDGGTRTTYKGTGLGMAITKKFIDLMGGSIDVESTLNVGTKFTIELWIDIDTETAADEGKADVHTDLNGMKVLLVEDIELNLEIAQAILEDRGAVITPAMNGQEAVDAFLNNPPGTFDIIIMDILMPVMDGITATKTIRAMERPDAAAIPIIAMTANAYEEDIRNTREAGMNAHLSKPIDVNMLFGTIAQFYKAPKPKSVDLAGMKVLLADDVWMNLEIGKALLESEGAVVTTAGNGKEAVDAFTGSLEGTLSVILMDLHMPLMDGIAAAKTIRAMARPDAAAIPIIAMTADAYDEDVQEIKAAGMNGHLAKPLDIEKMRWMLARRQDGS